MVTMERNIHNHAAAGTSTLTSRYRTSKQPAEPGADLRNGDGRRRKQTKATVIDQRRMPNVATPATITADVVHHSDSDSDEVLHSMRKHNKASKSYTENIKPKVESKSASLVIPEPTIQPKHELVTQLTSNLTRSSPNTVATDPKRPAISSAPGAQVQMPVKTTVPQADPRHTINKVRLGRPPSNQDTPKTSRSHRNKAPSVVISRPVQACRNSSLAVKPASIPSTRPSKDIIPRPPKLATPTNYQSSTTESNQSMISLSKQLPPSNQTNRPPPAPPLSPLILYPVYCYRDSPTFGTWVKLRINDIFRLKTASEASKIFTPDRNHSSHVLDDNGTTHPLPHIQNLYFFNNHPIRFVQITCPVITIADTYPGLLIFGVDDGSGALIEIRIREPPEAVYEDYVYNDYVSRHPRARDRSDDVVVTTTKIDGRWERSEPHPLLQPPSYPSSTSRGNQPATTTTTKPKPEPDRSSRRAHGLYNLLLVHIPPPITSLSFLSQPFTDTADETTLSKNQNQDYIVKPRTNVPRINISTLPIRSILIDGFDVQPGTVLKLKCTVSEYRGVRQLDAQRITVLVDVSGTMAEVKSWMECRHLRRDLLEPGWVIERKRVNTLRERAHKDRGG